MNKTEPDQTEERMKPKANWDLDELVQRAGMDSGDHRRMERVDALRCRIAMSLEGNQSRAWTWGFPYQQRALPLIVPSKCCAWSAAGDGGYGGWGPPTWICPPSPTSEAEPKSREFGGNSGEIRQKGKG